MPSTLDETGRAGSVVLIVAAILIVVGVAIGGYIAGFDGAGGTVPGSSAAAAESSRPGEALFQGYCGSCHTLAAARTNGRQGPNLDLAKPTADQTLSMIKAGGNIMPAEILTGERANLVARYVSEVAGGAK